MPKKREQEKPRSRRERELNTSSKKQSYILQDYQVHEGLLSNFSYFVFFSQEELERGDLSEREGRRELERLHTMKSLVEYSTHY